MLYFSKLRILFITLFSVLFILIASSNLFKFDDNFFDKKINLGLDLQGGSYLLLEIDNEPVIEQKLQNLTTTIRNYFKEKNININNIKIENQNIFFNVTENDKQSVLFSQDFAQLAIEEKLVPIKFLLTHAFFGILSKLLVGSMSIAHCFNILF